MINLQIFEWEGKKSVSGKQLYENLGYALKNWAEWSRLNIIRNAQAIEWTDWKEVQDISKYGVYLPSRKTSGGRPSNDFVLTVEFATHLCLQAKTTIGQRIRTYFIDCEIQVRKQQLEKVRALPSPALPEPKQDIPKLPTIWTFFDGKKPGTKAWEREAAWIRKVFDKGCPKWEIGSINVSGVEHRVMFIHMPAKPNYI